MKTNERNLGLDLIRVIAISLVLFSHTALLITPKEHQNHLFFIKFFGALGVDIFFVLSGFLVGGILLRLIAANDFSNSKIIYFWIRRWLRTLPNYYLILLVNIVIATLCLNQNFPYWKYVFFIQNFSSSQPDFFTESWSLSIEEFAYLIIPLVFILIYSVFKRITAKTFLFVTSATIILLFFIKLNYHFGDLGVGKTWSSSFRKVVIYRLDSIYLGFIAAYFYYSYTTIIQKSKYLLLVISIVIFTCIHATMYVLGSSPDNHLLFFNILYLPLVSALVLMVFPFVMHIQASKTLSNVITFISKRTYALYLVNYSIVLLTLEQIVDIDTETRFWMKLAVIAIFLIITFILAIVLYKFYEKPMMDLRDHPKVKRIFKTK